MKSLSSFEIHHNNDLLNRSNENIRYGDVGQYFSEYMRGNGKVMGGNGMGYESPVRGN